MRKQKKLHASFLANNRARIALCLIIALMITIPTSLAFATSITQPSDQSSSTIPSPTEFNTTNVVKEVASANTQFQLQVAYAYVGPDTSNGSSYFDQSTSTTMRRISQYPASVLLNISRLQKTQITGCDAVVELYGVKIATDTGLSESDAYFIGTNYNPAISNASVSTLVEYVSYLYNPGQFLSLSGNFKYNWDSRSSFLTETIGSNTVYLPLPSDKSYLGLFSAGKPTAISVTVYRIGYVTIANGSVTIFEDQPNKASTDIAQLGNYKSGYLYNNLVPSDELSPNLFRPVSHP
jgi:hypothetical protein